MKTLFGLAFLVFLLGCDDSHANAPASPASFHVPADGLMGDVGGGSGYYGTHWERFTDDRTGRTVLCFSPHNVAGGTGLEISCIVE